MKWLKRLLIGLVLVVIALVLIVNFYGGRLIRSAVNTAGPAALTVPVSLEDADFRWLRGKLALKGLAIGNPEGFKSDHLVTLGDLQVSLKPGSLLSDTIIIEKVYIHAPEFTYEKSLTGNNLDALLKNLEGDKKEGGEAEGKAEAKAPPAEPGKKVIIKDFMIENAKVHIALTALGGHGATLPLPTIHMENIGEDKGGASIPEVIGNIFGAVLKSITGVIAGAGDLVGEGAKATGEAVGDAGKAIGAGASKVLEGVGGLFGGGKKE
jgi:uncharacterized protein involved in outer membrane biogenesis